MNRKEFLKILGAASIMTPTMAGALSSCSRKTHKPFGVQLWTVQNEMYHDKIATLNHLSDYGYQLIESFDNPYGIFWGMRPTLFKNVLEDLGMQMLSSHIDSKYSLDPDSTDEFKKLVEEAASIGMTHLINPYPGQLKSNQDWRNLAKGLNRQGEICKPYDIKMGFHNHNQEFKPTTDGDIPFDILLKNTDPELVEFELDIYWAVWAGRDPEQLFVDNPGRITLAHIKDLYREERVNEIKNDPNEFSDDVWDVQASTVLGTGQIDFRKIVDTGLKNGLKHLIVEQERFDNSTPLVDSEKNAEFMKNLLRS